MEAANIGSAQASMRSTLAPSDEIAVSGVMMASMKGAKMYMITPIKVMTAMPKPTVV